jgi:hypothetical protein
MSSFAHLTNFLSPIKKIGARALRPDLVELDARDICCIRITGWEVKGDRFRSHNEFVVAVSAKTCEWVVHKRYSQFFSLYQTICHERLRSGSRVERVTFPEKIVGTLSPAQLSERKTMLQIFLNELLLVYNLHTELKDFLAQEANVQEVCFGGTRSNVGSVGAQEAQDRPLFCVFSGQPLNMAAHRVWQSKTQRGSGLAGGEREEEREGKKKIVQAEKEPEVQVAHQNIVEHETAAPAPAIIPQEPAIAQPIAPPPTVPVVAPVVAPTTPTAAAAPTSVAKEQETYEQEVGVRQEVGVERVNASRDSMGSMGSMDEGSAESSVQSSVQSSPVVPPLRTPEGLTAASGGGDAARVGAAAGAVGTVGQPETMSETMIGIALNQTEEVITDAYCTLHTIHTVHTVHTLHTIYTIHYMLS